MTAEPPIRLKFVGQADYGSSRAHVRGFLHLWAVYVRGFDPRFHCQRCLRGLLSARIKSSSTPLNTDLLLDEASVFDSIYLCGVARGTLPSRSTNNLHLPLEKCPGASFSCLTYNGYAVQVSNARVLSIPELPSGWMGLPDAYVRCRNFRFGVGRFGY